MKRTIKPVAKRLDGGSWKILVFWSDETSLFMLLIPLSGGFKIFIHPDMELKLSTHA